MSRHKIYNHQIKHQTDFECCVFVPVALTANFIALVIAKSVTKNGQFRSYLAFGGPSKILDKLSRTTNLI